MKNSRVERALLRDLARSVWKVVKTDDSFEVWFETCFENHMREALRAIDSACDYGFGDLDNGSSFEISRFQSRDGKTHKFTVDKQDLIDWFGDWALDAYAKYSDCYYSNQEIEKELFLQQHLILKPYLPKPLLLKLPQRQEMPYKEEPYTTE